MKYFIDSCNPQDTIDAVKLLGHIDGQTTNPTLLTKNPEIQHSVSAGKKLTRDTLLMLYKDAIHAIAQHTDGAVSVEVYADWDTTAEQMLADAAIMRSWSRNVYVKFPAIPEGLKAARRFTEDGGRVNMTLVFDLEQAAAVYSATIHTQGTAFVSPFVGRWDDRGFYGLDLIRHIRAMYDAFDKKRGVAHGHVEILAASIRTLDHMYGSIALGADILTAPLKTYATWVDAGRITPAVPPEKPDSLKHLPEKSLSFFEDFHQYSIQKDDTSLLHAGLMKFATDWNSVIAR